MFQKPSRFDTIFSRSAHTTAAIVLVSPDDKRDLML